MSCRQRSRRILPEGDLRTGVEYGPGLAPANSSRRRTALETAETMVSYLFDVVMATASFAANLLRHPAR